MNRAKPNLADITSNYENSFSNQEYPLAQESPKPAIPDGPEAKAIDADLGPPDDGLADVAGSYSANDFDPG